MKKYMRLITLALLLGLLLLPATFVKAASITSLSVTTSGSSISVSGTTEAVAGAVLVYDSTGETLVVMETFAVEDGSYSYTLSQTFSNGTYVVKVADYNGGDYATETVTVSEKTGTTTTTGTTTATGTTSTTTKSPKTGDSYLVYFWAMLMFSLAGIISVGVHAYRKEFK